MKKMLFLVCSVLFISTLNSCGGGAGKAARAAAGASILIQEASENVSFKGRNRGRCQNKDTYYKRISASNTNCVHCKKSWNDHIGASGSAPDNWD